MNRRPVRRLAAAAALAIALPALAYVPSVSAILKRAAEKRASLSLAALEVAGTLELHGEAGARLGASMNLPPAADGRLSLPARFLLKVPGRCRLELVRPGVPEAERPYLTVRDGRLGGRGLETVPAAAALARAACALLAIPATGDGERAYAQALTRRSVGLEVSSLGRFDGRIAFVVGGQPGEQKPLAWFDKETSQPLRLITSDPGAPVLDARLLGWGSPQGGEWFPQAVEVFEGADLRARFATVKASANPKLADALF